MRPKYTLSSLLCATLICALGIMAYRQTKLAAKLRLQVEIHDTLRQQMARVIQREDELRSAIDEMNTNRNATLSYASQRVSVSNAFLPTFDRNRRRSEEREVHTAKLKLTRERELLKVFEALAQEQMPVELRTEKAEP
ncbi:hypothetical protein SH528x_003464 [Novipirellula sp. SH528]